MRKRKSKSIRKRIGSAFSSVVRKIKQKNIRFYIGFGLIIGSVALTCTLYSVCGYRAYSAARDLITSLVYAYTWAFGKDDIFLPTVNQKLNIDISRYLPISMEEVYRKINAFWEGFWNIDTFLDYIFAIFKFVNRLMMYGPMWIVCIVGIIYLFFDRYTRSHIEIKGKRRISRFILFVYGILKRCTDFIRSCFEYFKDHKGFLYALAFIWLVNTNVFTILVEVVAYYFYFLVTFDFLSLITQAGKLVCDVVIMLWTLPLLLWALIGYKVFDFIRVRKAIRELEHMEAKNRGYDNSLPIVSMCTGTMGKGKTKTAVDISLSMENQYRDKSLEFMDRNMMRFPNFDFQAFEGTLKELIKERKIINLATTRQYIQRMRYEYGRHPSPDKFWGYNVGRFPRSYNNGVELVGIWACLENYAQEYFIYSMSVSLIISNFAIRSDLDPSDEGYFMLYSQSFFKRDPAKLEEYAVYSHIIDFDLYRIGCQMNKENAIAGSFEFGVIVVTEIGKERQNALELKETKKSALEANQKNDKFNEWLKMIRHAATVEGYCFVCFICDEQRAASWGADARDLCAVLNIEEVSEQRTTLIYCWLPEIFMNVVVPKYFKWRKKVRQKGNLNVFTVQMLHRIMSAYYHSCEKKMLTYGYYVEIIGQESGTLEDSEIIRHEYYIMPKKIYAKRYATDCFKEGFAQKALEAGTSLYYMDTYTTYCAMLEELGKQNSYFANLFLNMYVNTAKKE